MNEIKINEFDDILRDLLNMTLKESISLLGAERGSLFLFDHDNKELILDSLYNSDDLQLKGLRQRVGDGICGKVIDIKEPVLVKDIEKDQRFKSNGFGHYRTKSFISIPLFSFKGPLGVINISDKLNAEPFNEKDLDLSVLICKYACLVINSFIDNKELDKQKQLLENYASVGKLASGIIHEINNPLDGVIRYTNILLSQKDSDSVTREYLLEIKKGLNRIANITRSLLEFSHQVNSSYYRAKRYIDIHKSIDESLEIFKEKIDGRIQINKRYNWDLPKILDLGIFHIFVNIIKNALDAMPGGGSIEISTDIKDPSVEMKFKDSGSGIHVGIKEQIFDPFFTTKSKDKGAGLGLAICKEIINRYEGRIEVESSVGKGSIFTISIPKKYLKNGHFKF